MQKKAVNNLVWCKVQHRQSSKVDIESQKKWAAGLAELRRPLFETLLKGQVVYRWLIVARSKVNEGKIRIYFGIPADRYEGVSRLFANYFPGTMLAKADEDVAEVFSDLRGTGKSRIWDKNKDKNKAETYGTKLIPKYRGETIAYPLLMPTRNTPDALAAIISSLEVEPESNQISAVEITFTPGSDRQLRRITSTLEKKRLKGNVPGGGLDLESFSGRIWAEIRSPGSTTQKNSAGQGYSTRHMLDFEKEELEGIREKGNRSKAFQTNIRILAHGFASKARMQTIVSSMSNATRNINYLVPQKLKANKAVVKEFREGALNNSFLISSHELASIIHPLDSMEEAAFEVIDKPEFKTIRPPGILLKNAPGCIRVGWSNDPSTLAREIFLHISQLLKHAAIFGGTGAGKTSFLLSIAMALAELLEIEQQENQNINAPGFTYLDMHGDATAKLATNLPASLHDKVHITTVKTDRPRGMNLFDTTNIEFKEDLVSQFILSLQALFPKSTGPRMEHYTRNALLTMLAKPPQTILGIPHLFFNEPYREQLLKDVQNELPDLVRFFWDKEFGGNTKIIDAVGPILNKIGALATTTDLRVLLGQPESSVKPRKVMDSGHIHLVDLSRADSESKKIVASLYCIQYHLTALSRWNIAEKERKPHILFADEMHLYPIAILGKIAAEDRKFGLSLIAATQELNQVPDKLLSSLINVCGNNIFMGVGGEDALTLSKWTKTLFDNNDLSSQPDLNAAWIMRSRQGLKGFTLKTRVWDEDRNSDSYKSLMKLSDERDGRPIAEVEKAIQEMYPLPKRDTMGGSITGGKKVTDLQV